MSTLALLVATALLAVGCGGDAGREAQTATETTSAAATRTVAHALGTTEVPAEPRRIVTLWRPTLAALLALGVEPVGTAADPRLEEAGLRPYVPPDFDIGRLEIVGSVLEPNLERIAALRPDLILGIGSDSPEVRGQYERLSQIAPTVLFDWAGTPAWKQHFDDVAAALGLEEKGKKVVGDYRAQARAVADAIEGRAPETDVSIVVFQAADLIRLQARNSFAGQVVADVGLGRPDSQDVVAEDTGHVEISLERLAAVDGDALFLMVAPGAREEASALLEQARANPLWSTLEAVRSNAVYTVDFNVWLGSNYFAARRVLDDLRAALGGKS